MQITGLELEIYIDGECYTKDMADTPGTYSYDSFSNYILPTDSRYITSSDLAPFSKEEVALIRNEIYARYGCTFNNATYRTYFESQSWYYPVEGRNASNFNTSMLNDYERKNIDTKPMDEEEAILQMELLNHDFFVFKNVDEECVSVMYKRRDGNYGIINVK